MITDVGYFDTSMPKISTDFVKFSLFQLFDFEKIARRTIGAKAVHVVANIVKYECKYFKYTIKLFLNIVLNFKKYCGIIF